MLGTHLKKNTTRPKLGAKVGYLFYLNNVILEGLKDGGWVKNREGGGTGRIYIFVGSSKN